MEEPAPIPVFLKDEEVVPPVADAIEEVPRIVQSETEMQISPKSNSRILKVSFKGVSKQLEVSSEATFGEVNKLIGEQFGVENPERIQLLKRLTKAQDSQFLLKNLRYFLR